jgi:hypothetical protein
MKNLHCPQCEIHRFQVKNALNESVVVTVNEHCEVIPVHAGDSLVGFDMTIIYCLGCSWQGSPQSLKKGRHK